MRDYAKRFQLGHWSFLGLGEEENGTERTHTNLKHKWNSTADVVVSDFEHSGHPVFRASSALDRGFLKKAGGKCSTSAKLLFRAINFANQLSIYGAVADWFSELIQQIFGQSFSRMKESTANVNEQLYRKLERSGGARVGTNT